MANRVKRQKKKEGKLIQGKFPMEKSPVAVQLTVHVNNAIIAYGNKVTVTFKHYLKNPILINHHGISKQDIRVKQIINHYGVNTCKQWFVDIYGWDFNKKEKVS